MLVNLASQEYFGAVDVERLGARVVSPRFEDRNKDGVPDIVSFHAKRARGTMAAWLIRNRVRSASALLDFAEDGYTLDKARSTAKVRIARRGVDSSSQRLGRHRWIIERTIAWLVTFQRLDRRWDRTATTTNALLTLAAAYTTMRFLDQTRQQL